MNIAFCINSLALQGLSVTVTSLIRNCSNTRLLAITFLCNELLDIEKKQIEKLLEIEGFLGKYQFVNFNPIPMFSEFKSLHGDYTTYGRLVLVDITEGDSVLYLDADLVVEVDVLELLGFNFNGYALAAVESGILETALEKDFYINKLKLAPTLKAFNAGVIMLNLKIWRENNLKEECIKLGRKYPMDLLSCDQAILNGLFAGKFENLPVGYNCSWYSHERRPQIARRMIFHFVGSPKPWDPLGFIIHNGYKTWIKYLNVKLGVNSKKHLTSSLIRVWNIRRSYVKSLINKVSMSAYS